MDQTLGSLVLLPPQLLEELQPMRGSPIFLATALVLTLAVAMARPVSAQSSQHAVTPQAGKVITTDDVIKYGVAGLAGLGIGFLLLEGNVIPGGELFGYTERFLAPAAGLVGGAVLANMGYLDPAFRSTLSAPGLPSAAGH